MSMQILSLVLGSASTHFLNALPPRNLHGGVAPTSRAAPRRQSATVALPNVNADTVPGAGECLNPLLKCAPAAELARGRGPNEPCCPEAPKCDCSSSECQCRYCPWCWGVPQPTS